MWEEFEAILKQYLPFLDGMLYSKEFLSAIFGGAMSTATAAVIFWLGSRLSRMQREREDMARRADLALSGYVKIYQSVNTLANMKQMFDRVYQEAAADGHLDWEPYQIVGPIAGKFPDPQAITASEGAFLFKNGKVDIFQNAILLSDRVTGNIATLIKITEIYEKMHDWLDGLEGIDRVVDGDIARDQIPDQYLPRFSMFAGSLNGLLTGLITTLDLDVPASVKLANDYIDAARVELKDSFPNITVGQAPPPGVAQ